MQNTQLSPAGRQTVRNALVDFPRPDRAAADAVRKWAYGQGVDLDPDQVEAVTLHYQFHDDVPPFASVSGRRATLKGLNLVGLRRRGFDKALIRELDDAYDFLFDESAENEDMPLTERAKKLERRTKSPEVKALADFVLATSRGMTGYDDDE